MHSIYFVKIDKEAVDSHEEALSTAEDKLLNEGFCSEGFFCSGKADWFQVGGRWSGVLTLASLDQKKLKDVYEKIHNTKKEEEEKNNGSISESYEKDIAISAMKDSFPVFGGWGIDVPFAGLRDGLRKHSDDAIIMTKEIVKQLKEDWNDNVEVALIDGDGDFCDEIFLKDLDEEECEGNWMVVIDYHY